MNKKPLAVERFESEQLSEYADESFFLEHPIERLKYHIELTGGKIIQSDSSADGSANVIWESEGIKYSAWSTWPDANYAVNWKQLD